MGLLPVADPRQHHHIDRIGTFGEAGPGGGGQNPVERTDRAIVRAAVLAAR